MNKIKGDLISFYFKAALGLAYMLMGAVVIFYRNFWLGYPPIFAVAFGVLCIVYGIFRLVRAYNFYKEITS